MIEMSFSVSGFPGDGPEVFPMSRFRKSAGTASLYFNCSTEYVSPRSRKLSAASSLGGGMVSVQRVPVSGPGTILRNVYMVDIHTGDSDGRDSAFKSIEKEV